MEEIHVKQEARKAYSEPAMVEFGRLEEKTLGCGTTPLWDMGSGLKGSCIPPP